MEQLIIHACGHGQTHHLAGFASQQERKARWLRTTKCRTCFHADRRSEQAEAVACASAATAHLNLPPLAGSDRQIAWATTIRATRMAALVARGEDAPDHHACLLMTEARWWINHRDLADKDLIAKAALGTVSPPAGGSSVAGISRAA